MKRLALAALILSIPVVAQAANPETVESCVAAGGDELMCGALYSKEMGTRAYYTGRIHGKCIAAFKIGDNTERLRTLALCDNQMAILNRINNPGPQERLK